MALHIPLGPVYYFLILARKVNFQMLLKSWCLLNLFAINFTGIFGTPEKQKVYHHLPLQRSLISFNAYINSALLKSFQNYHQ